MGGFFWRIRQSLQRFMRGRYGTDKLNMLILGTGALMSPDSIKQGLAIPGIAHLLRIESERN